MISTEKTASKTADAIVVGGGVIGLSIARALAKRRFGRVLLIERGSLASEASYAAAGMLAAQSEANRPDAFLELALASRELYHTLASELCDETGIDIQLEETGTLYLGFREDDDRELAHRYEWQQRAGLEVEKLNRKEALELEPNVNPALTSALLFPKDIQVDNRKLLAGLITSVEAAGVEIITAAEAKAIRTNRNGVTGVSTAAQDFEAPIVVVACGAWTSILEPPSPPSIRIEPVRGQLLCFEAQPTIVRHVVYSPRGYIVPRVDGRLLAGSTTEAAGYDNRVTTRGINAIMRQALEIAPSIDNLAFVDAWSGLRPRSEDGRPILGAVSSVKGLFYATGHYRNGILLAPLTGELIAEQIVSGSMPALLKSFTLDRFCSVEVA